MDNRVLELRIKQKMSVEEVAKIIDIPAERIREIENNSAPLTEQEIKKFSILFNVRADEIYRNEDFKFEEIKPEEIEAKERKEDKKEKKVKEGKTFFKRPLLFFPPILMALLFLFMALPCYGGDIDFGITTSSYSFSIFDLMLTNVDGQFLDDGLATIGIIMIILNSLAIIYFVCAMVVGKEVLKKLERYNVAILGLSGVINFAFALATILIIGGTEALLFSGVASYFVWFAYSFYAVVVALIGLYNVTKSTKDEEESFIDGFSTKSRFGLLFTFLPLIIETILLAVISLSGEQEGNEILIFFVMNLVILLLVAIFYTVIVFTSVATRLKLRTAFDVVNGAVVLFNIIWLICTIPPVFEEVIVMSAVNILIFGLYYLLHLRKNRRKTEKARLK